MTNCLKISDLRKFVISRNEAIQHYLRIALLSLAMTPCTKLDREQYNTNFSKTEIYLVKIRVIRGQKINMNYKRM